MAGMKFKVIKCPFCDKHSAQITYEEARIYQMKCPECGNTILHRDRSWDAAVRFFEHLKVVEEGR